MRRIYHIWYVLMALMLVACATTPKTFNQSLAVAYGTLTGVRQTATVLLKDKRITVDEAKKIQDSADSARGLLDIAADFSKEGNDVSAMSKLEMAEKILAGLEIELKKKGASP